MKKKLKEITKKKITRYQKVLTIALFYIVLSFTLYSEKNEIKLDELSETNILGYWITNEKVGSEAIIELKRDPDTLEYYGVIKKIAFPEEGKKEIPVLTEDPFINIKIIYGFKYNEERKRYLGGRVLDPTNGNIYYARLRVDKKGLLVLRGSLDPWSILGANRRWGRVYSDNFVDKVKN